MFSKATANKDTRQKGHHKNQDKHRWRNVAAWVIPFVTVPVTVTVFTNSTRGVWLSVFFWCCFLIYTLVTIERYVWHGGRRRWRLLCALACGVAIGLGFVWQANIPPEQPELYFESTLDPLVVGQSLTMRSVIRNVGKANAYDLNLCHQVFLLPASFQGPIKLLDASGKRINPTIVQSIPINTPITMVSGRSDTPMTTEIIDAIKNGRSRLFFVGTGQYRDQFNKQYPARFCLMYSSKMPGGLQYCPQHYLPTDDDPNTTCPNPN
jgi:hypothetical protein